MVEVINCNYARVAIRHFSSKRLPSSRRFPKGIKPKILADYNHHFTDNENLKGTYSLASRKFPIICQHFNRRWNTTEVREEYLTTFSVTAWKKLSPEEKRQHIYPTKVQSMRNPISSIECCFSMQTWQQDKNL